MKTFLDERLYGKAEVLIINDGSSDRTAELAAGYEEKYRGYIRLINKENGGHGSVINRGIREAEGRYFKIVDADDWVNTENLVRLVNDLEKNDADIVINPYVAIDQQSGKEKKIEYSALKHYQSKGVADIILQNNVLLALHAITYRTSILRDNNISFTEKCFYEDFQYDLYPVPYLKTFIALDYPVYWYLIGQKTQSVDAANALKNVDMYYKVFCDMVDYYEKEKHQYSKCVDEYMQNNIIVFLRSLYNIFLRNGFSKCTFEKFVIIDNKIRNYTEYFYNLITEKNHYIKLMQKKSILTLNFLSLAMKIYKNV